MLDYIKDRWVIAATGSKEYDPNANKVNKELMGWLEKRKAEHPNLVVMSGAQQGWDYWVTHVARLLNIPYVLAIPNDSFVEYYWRNDMSTARIMLQEAAATHIVCDSLWGSKGFRGGANLDRNEFMVQHADEFAVLWGKSGGTRHCFGCIERHKLPYQVFPLDAPAMSSKKPKINSARIRTHKTRAYRS